MVVLHEELEYKQVHLDYNCCKNKAPRMVLASLGILPGVIAQSWSSCIGKGVSCFPA